MFQRLVCRRIVSIGAAAALAVALTACHKKSPTQPGGQIAITGLTPTSGSSFGGTSVTINGSGFVPGVFVFFGGTAATDVVVVSDAQLTATTPPHVAGPADVTVSVPGASSNLEGAFTYTVAQPGENAPPVITRLRSVGMHPNQPSGYAELKEAVTLAADVTDMETPSDQLQYEWSAARGAIDGMGATVMWQPPADLPVPGTVTITLTVVETYQVPDDQGLPVDRENRVTKTIDMSVHDGPKEVGDMAAEFLELFSDSNVPAQQVVHNFFDRCLGLDGHTNEQQDVRDNRTNYTILEHHIGDPTFQLAFNGSCTIGNRTRFGDACTNFPVMWRSINHANGGATEVVTGIDQVTAVFKTSRWYLCESDFQPDESTTGRIRRR